MNTVIFYLNSRCSFVAYGISQRLREARTTTRYHRLRRDRHSKRNVTLAKCTKDKCVSSWIPFRSSDTFRHRRIFNVLATIIRKHCSRDRCVWQRAVISFSFPDPQKVMKTTRNSIIMKRQSIICAIVGGKTFLKRNTLIPNDKIYKIYQRLASF